MPQMANITVKKNDGTTDVIYTQQAPSAGDRSPAIWHNQTVGASMGHRPVLSIVARANGAGTARRVESSFIWKQVSTDTTTGLVSIANSLPITISAAVPDGMPDADVNEGISQCFNLHASTLVKDCYKQRFAAT